jgi:hypothetical protein
MSCSPFDLRDYYFKDLAENQRRLTEVHVKTCAHCREELERLRGTETALLALPDEEIPQRIGFVSDAVFQPSAFRRGWDALWNSAAGGLLAYPASDTGQHTGSRNPHSDRIGPVANGFGQPRKRSSGQSCGRERSADQGTVGRVR